jgi:hypothetical protein
MSLNVKERSIIFSTEMVNALLAARKTQTRRLVKVGGVPWTFPLSADAIAPGMLESCKYGKVGDRLWVREKIYCFHGFNLPSSRPQDLDGSLHDYSYYGCDYATNIEDSELDAVTKVISPIYMPRWCCRIELVLTCILIKRVSDISEADAIAEGLIPKQIDNQIKYGLQGYRDEEYIGNPRIVLGCGC